MRKQKQMLRNAQSRKGQRPKTTKSPTEVITEFMLWMTVGTRPQASGGVQYSIIPSAYPPCVTPLASLKKTMIRNLTLETHHRGPYLPVRVMTPTDKISPVLIHHQVDKLPTHGHMAQGTVMVSREPYLKLMSDEDYGIRVDHPSDLVLLAGRVKMVPAVWREQVTERDTSAVDWKRKGNNYFKLSQFYLAIDCYSAALDTTPTPEEFVTIRLNRALAFSKTYQYDAALRDLDNNRPDSKLAEKALFRKGQALYNLERFDEAHETYAILCKEYPDNTSAKIEMDQTNARLAEQRKGQYNFVQMQKEAASMRPPHLDRATYVGPVAVRNTASHGRGLFTTKNVKAGDLLWCEKALAHEFHDPNGLKGISWVINMETEDTTIGTQTGLLARLVQKLYKHLSLIPKVTDLHHGSYKSVDVSRTEGDPAIVDVFLIELIATLNCFGCPLSTRTSHLDLMNSNNSKQANERPSDSCGLWILSSYVSHSCLSNARRSFIGDMMIVRATSNIPRDTEIRFPYLNSWHVKHEFSIKGADCKDWGFTCECALCQDRQNTPKAKIALRKKTSEEVIDILISSFGVSDANTKKNLRAHPPVSQLEKLLTLLETTYRLPAIEVPRYTLWTSYVNYALLWASRNNHAKTIMFAVKALECLGFVIEGAAPPYTPSSRLRVKRWGLIIDETIACWMVIARAFENAAPALVEPAEGFARVTYRSCVGEDGTFGDNYSRSSGRLDGFVSDGLGL
ncbi:TPR domain protein [Aspergillus karnatakaensis]|uniref:TPR domain protein n=1 Tax=Aspergillus karnatakaensis TaxID=1810916 RepID=UPI003CCD4CAB